MKMRNLLWALIIPALFTACEEESTTSARTYPEGSVIWKNDTTITDHVVIPVGTSLYVEAGVTVTMDNINVGPELVVLGNIYCLGTSDKPVKFTCAEIYRNKENRYKRTWGGIICGYESEEALLENTIIEYGGAQTTEESESFKNQLFKTVTGEGVPAFHFCNTAGSFVIKNCIFRNNAEDQIYITGGKSIVVNNVLYHNGFDGGDAINYKAGCNADIAYNLIYDTNTNALKLSNNGVSTTIPSSHLFAYNNTIVNTGWRRPKVKGGSIWLEYNVYAELYNNLVFDARWACKEDVANVRDPRSVITPNYFFASTATGVTQYAANPSKGQLVGANDVVSASAGDKNPMFTNFTIQSTIDINVGTTQSGKDNEPQDFNENWDFTLKSTSPAINKGTTAFNRHYATDGIVIDGKTFTSPVPSANMGAFGVK